VRAAIAQFGPLDILVNNAGLMLLGPVAGADVEVWERMIAVNQSGLLYVTHAALPHLLAAAQDELRGFDARTGIRPTTPWLNVSHLGSRPIAAWRAASSHRRVKRRRTIQQCRSR
jgi:NAD(P)-dependent dehydrogenase (short-subunit alcohol dehydrogenase family)